MASHCFKMDALYTRLALGAVLVTALVVTVNGNCGRPMALQFADLSKRHADTATFPIDSSVSYVCRPGYVKTPGKLAVRKCLANSQWSVISEFCEPRECGNPGELHHGWVQVNGTIVGSTAIFGCDEGYRLVGSRPLRRCLDTGAWSNAVPVCEPVICGPPPDTQDAIHSGLTSSEYSYLTSVTYRCIQGALVGVAAIYCTQHGNWSGPAPECIDVSCPMPQVKHGVLVAGFASRFTYGDSVVVRCQDGFILKGTGVLKCGRGGDWHPATTKCVHTVSCPEPDVANGRITFGAKETFQSGFETGYRVFAQVSFECDPGYELVGKSTIQCQLDKKWHPNKPSCAPKSGCRKPNIANGYETTTSGRKLGFNRSHYSRKSMTYIACDPGYTLKGSREAQCGEAFEWEPPLPSCLLLEHSAPIQVQHSVMLQSEAVAETLTCPAKFLPAGRKNFICAGDDSAGSIPANHEATPASAGALCKTLEKSLTENWQTMGLQDKYTHLDLQKLCLDIRDLHLQIEKLNATSTPCAPKKGGRFWNIGFSV
ncbi:C4b-binding protein-like [Ambystoma mexicanum]|uniref:C4b-binding protein-like n=1 Tax=Ambystoma mexicanum TaxID=8296 RepID=UPI0037E9064A